MESIGGDGFPLTWVARLVERSRSEYELLRGLEVEMAAEGRAGVEVDGMSEVFSIAELRERYDGLAMPEPGDYDAAVVFEDVDQFRLTCVFVLGVLGRWEEAFQHLGPFPGSFDRGDPELFQGRLDVLTAMLEDGRWEDVVRHGAALSFDCEMVLGEGSASAVATLVMRAEALARLGEKFDALHLFRLALELGASCDGLDDLVLESARAHETFLLLGAPEGP